MLKHFEGINSFTIYLFRTRFSKRTLGNSDVNQKINDATL